MDPDLELQGLIVNTLLADPDVKALVGPRVFDRVKQDEPFPLISYGPSQSITDTPTCLDGATVYVQLDVWSREVGFPQAKRISEAVRKALHDRDDLQLAQNALVYLIHTDSNPMRDPDGITSRVRMNFEAAIERR